MTGLEYLRRAVNLAEHGLTVELHAYQCHVFLDWRELRSTAEWPWDTLCDHLAGRGVPNLDDALISLELRPTHDALRGLLEPALMRTVAELSKSPGGLEKQMAQEILREDFFVNGWTRYRKFLREAQTFYRSHGEQQAQEIVNPVEMQTRFREQARAAMRIPSLEALFAEPWPAAARRVLPSYSPQLTATAMWGPVLAWAALEVLAESVNAVHPQRAALDLFDRLRLREPLGHAFDALGFEGEEAWRVAARIKVALLVEAKVFTTEDEMAVVPSARPVIPVLSPALWQDPDVRWLTGAHEAEGRWYFIKESYEELLWWLQLPALCRMAEGNAASPLLAAGAGAKAPASEAYAMAKAIAEAVEAATRAGYSIDALLAESEAVYAAHSEPEAPKETAPKETNVDGAKGVKEKELPK
jgi:hypothetical protein